MILAARTLAPVKLLMQTGLGISRAAKKFLEEHPAEVRKLTTSAATVAAADIGRRPINYLR